MFVRSCSVPMAIGMLGVPMRRSPTSAGWLRCGVRLRRRDRSAGIVGVTMGRHRHSRRRAEPEGDSHDPGSHDTGHPRHVAAGRAMSS
jgi:hypothetical protein